VLVNDHQIRREPENGALEDATADVGDLRFAHTEVCRVVEIEIAARDAGAIEGSRFGRAVLAACTATARGRHMAVSDLSTRGERKC
jgi:hypothetical protein